MLWRAEEHEPLVASGWDADAAHRAIERIVADAERSLSGWAWPGHPLDDLGAEESLTTIYLGSAGVIWALARLGSACDLDAALEAALGRYRATPDFEQDGAHPPSLWMGETGLPVVAHALGSPAADGSRLRAPTASIRPGS